MNSQSGMMETELEKSLDQELVVGPVWHAGEFPPFEEVLLCPGCERPLPMMLSSAHLEMEIRCPRCTRSLTGLIRRAIRRRSGG